MTLNVQLMTMVSMVIGGFYLGIAHDTFERFAHLWRRRQLLAYFIAITFWLVQALMIFYLLYRANYGELRIYVFLACLLGLSIYQVFASRIYRRLLNGLLTFLKRLFTIIYTIFKFVILRPIQLLFMVLLYILNVVKKMIFSLINVILFPFKMLGKGLYRLLPNKIKKVFHKSSSFYSIIELIYSKLRELMSSIRR